MMKSLKILCVGLGLALAFGSCTKKVSPLLEAIPADAFFVLDVNAEQLMAKSGELSEYRFVNKLREEILSKSSSISELLYRLLFMEKITGLNTDRWYLFGVKADTAIYVALLAQMDDVKAFEDSTRPLLATIEHTETTMIYGADSSIVDLEARTVFDTLAVQDADTYKFCENPDIGFAWNDKQFVYVLKTDFDVDLASFFVTPNTNSIKNIPDFEDFSKKDYDIGFWADYGILVKESAQFFSAFNQGMMSPISDMFTDSEGLHIHCGLIFDSGEAKLSACMAPHDKMEELMAKYPLIKQKPDNSVLRDLPEQSYFSFKVSLNLMEYFKLLAKTVPELSKKMLTDPEMSETISAFDGDAVFSIYDFAHGPMPIPLAGLSFTVKDEATFDKLREKLGIECTQQDNYYKTSSSLGLINVYLAYKDGRVYVTDDVESMKVFVDKGYSEPLASGALGDLLSETSVFYINLDLNSYPENVQSALQGIGTQANGPLSWLAPYKELRCYSTANYESVISLKFKTGENALRQLMKSVDDITESYN